MNKPIALSAGEPAGISPLIILKAALSKNLPAFIVFCDQHILKKRARDCHISITIKEGMPEKNQHTPGTLFVHHIPALSPVIPGTLDKKNSPYVIDCLNQAIDGCLNQQYSALVTAPIQKSIINDAGIHFTGHTEYLKDRCGVSKTIMCFFTPTFKVALQTTHLPLSKVSSTITQESLRETLVLLHSELQKKLAIKNPKILICGLNPHAGENGYLGLEEKEIMIPMIASLKKEGYQLDGPHPADTAFTQQKLKNYDIVLSLYHDQCLPVVKYAAFETAVNVTLGLPIIRTSVDHGTALSLATSDEANADNLISALTLANYLSKKNNSSY